MTEKEYFTRGCTTLNYEVLNEAVWHVWSCRPLSADWKQCIDEDVKQRGR